MADEKPPGDGTIWGEVLDQLTDALDQANLTDGSMRNVVVDGVRDALSALTGMGFPLEPDSESAPRSEEGPDITVVEGGRTEDTPASDAARPDLRVADPIDKAESDAAAAGVDEASGDDKGSHDGPMDDKSTWVRVLTSGQMEDAMQGILGDRFDLKGGFPSGQVAGLSSAVPPGEIAVGARQGAKELQTLFRGETARAYRVKCSEGDLRVIADGLPVESLSKGQSLDVEAKLIQAACEAEQSASGEYWRV